MGRSRVFGSGAKRASVRRFLGDGRMKWAMGKSFSHMFAKCGGRMKSK